MMRINKMFYYIHHVNKYIRMNNTFFHLEDILLQDIDYPCDENYKNVLLQQHLENETYTYTSRMSS